MNETSKNICKDSASELDRIRNVGIIAHIDAGKTTITERILFHTGKIHRTGEVHDGEATMDYMPEERERGITITSAATTVEWKRNQLSLIDTPGHVDFTAEVERSLRVLDGVVGVFCGVAGVEAQSETVWRQATRHGVPRIAFINKLDRIGADFQKAIDSIRKRLNTVPVPVQWPIIEDQEVKGIIDLIEQKYIRFEEKDGDVVFHEEAIPEEHKSLAEEHYTELVEAAAEFNDDLMARYLDGEEVTPQEIRDAVREGALSGGIVPTLSGTALKNRGIEQLLDAIIAFLPSPRNKPIVEGKRPGDDDGKLIHIDAVPESPLCALAFKTVVDKNGDLTFVRVYSGVLHRGEQVWNPRLRRQERIGRMFQMHADSREAVEAAKAGEIVAIVGLKEAMTGDTLCLKENPILLEDISFPEPVISMSIAPKSRGDRDKLGEILARIAREDPTFHFFNDEETDETIIAGMGELHLEVTTDRLTREFKLNVNLGRPEVAYKQAFTKEVDLESRYVKQSGGHGQFAVVKMKIGPNTDEEIDSNFVFESTVVGGRVPREYFRPVEHGIRDSIKDGGPLRYPFVKVKAELYDGSYHEVDSSEKAFHSAARQAFQMAIQKAGVTIMEPIVAFEVQIPDEFLGDVLGDLNTRRCQIESLELEGGVRVLKGRVPLAETFKYATQLRSLTQGRGTYSLEPGEYNPVPKSIAEEVTKQRLEKLSKR